MKLYLGKRYTRQVNVLKRQYVNYEENLSKPFYCAMIQDTNYKLTR